MWMRSRQMKRRRLILALFPALLHAQERPAPVQPFTVSLPRYVDPQTAMIDYMFRIGDEGSGGWLGTRAGVFDYAIKPDSHLGAPTSLKLAIYIPGYRMMTPEFTSEDLRTGKTYVPQPVPLPTTTLKGRLIDSAGRPLGGEHLKLDYLLTEVMGYYGYADGMTPTIHIADTRTDGDGRFELDVPSLLDDPFFENTRSPGFFQITNGRDARGVDDTLNPNSLQVQKTYEPLTIRKTRNGTLSGKLGTLFLGQNNVPESKGLKLQVTPSDAKTQTITLSEMEMSARRPVNPVPTFSAPVNADGSFELQVPAGKYDVQLWVPGGNRFIPLERGIVVEEDRRNVLERP